MMRAHGIASNPSPTSRAPKTEREEASGSTLKSSGGSFKSNGSHPRAGGIAPKPSGGAPKSSGVASKKRKADAFMEDNTNADDEEVFPNIKPEREHQKVKQEEGKQLSMSEAADLMKYYEPSYNRQFSGDLEYNGSEYSGNGSGFATPVGGAYSMDSSDFDFSSMYDSSSADMGAAPKSAQGYSYQPATCQYTTEGQGYSDSPVILE